MDPPRDRLALAYRGRNPDRILAAAREVPNLTLADAVRIAAVLVDLSHPLADRARGRLVGRLLADRPLGLEDADVVMQLARELPDRLAVDQLLRFAEPPRD